MNNEDKILAMLERMEERQQNTESVLAQLQQGQTALQGEVSSINKRLNGMDKRLENVEDSLAEVINSQRTVDERVNKVWESQLRVEMEQFPRITAALDGNKMNAEKNAEQDRRISAVETAVDEHDIRLFALEQVG